MDVSEKTLARHLFQNKIYKADGQKFEDIFTQIMGYAEQDFQQIKPWGNIGDRKNDGYIKSKAIYYQVHAPEDILKSYTEVVSKLRTDFAGLQKHWNPINEFFFVVNDKYKGVNADCEKTLQEIKEANGLVRAGFLTAKDLENALFSLDDDQIMTVTGFIPKLALTQQLDYSILSEVIEYIMELPINNQRNSNLIVPEWEKKLVFNDLSSETGIYLESGYLQRHSLDEYLMNNGDFLADALRDKMNEIYCEQKAKHSGDDLFWSIVNYASPKEVRSYQTTVIIILSKYFETCDVFEEPPQDWAV